MYVTPVSGRSVPDPARNDALPAEGRNVDGDVVATTRAPTQEEA